MLLYLLHNMSSSGGAVTVPGSLPAARAGQDAYLVSYGDSISIGASRGVNDSYGKYTGEGIGRSWLSTGHGGQTTSTLLSTYSTDVLAHKPNIVLLEGGVNDIAYAGATPSSVVATVVANHQSMVNQAVADGAWVVFIPILPWANGNADQNTAIDDINAQLIAWMQATHPTHLIADMRALVGEPRDWGPPGNLWTIKTKYYDDGTHFNSLADQDMGAFMANLILTSI